MPHPLQKFRSYEIAEDSRGASLELWRSDREVVCLASDPVHHAFAELHVLATVEVNQDSAGPVIEAFRQQTQALLRVDDPHVIGLRETGEDEGALFYLTEFIDGETLDTYLARCNPLPAWLAAELAVQVTRGLLAIRDEPSLLAGVEVFNARLALEGGMTSDLCVKLADFTLGEALAQALAPQENEHRATREVGRLLLYALSGMVSEKVSPRTLAALPVPVELARLLGDLLDPGAARPTTDLTRLLAALDHSRHNPALSTRPARLPQSLRPRLMLQSHFPSLGDLASRLGRGYRLERTAFDAAQPYAQRAFAGENRPVTVQLLPPGRLMAQTYLPRIRLAAERVTANQSAHLLRVLDIAPDKTWFIEESVPRISVDVALRLRRELTAAEAASLLREIDRAVVAAEKLGLSAASLAPQEMFLEFISKTGGPASPTDDELSTRTIDQWPPFRIRLRAHPVTAQFIQPQRFRRERLVARGVTSRAESELSTHSTQRSPEAADYAALFLWLCGGPTRVPANLAPLVAQTMAGSGEPDRRAFLERIVALIPKCPKPVARSTSKPPKPAPPARAERNSSRRTPGKVPATSQTVSVLPPAVVPSVSVTMEPEPALAAPPPDFGALIGSDTEAAAPGDDAGGFAEMLFGRPTRLTKSDDTVVPDPAGAVEGESEDIPVGALFAGNWPQGAATTEPEDPDPMVFHPSHSPADRPGLGRLLLLIILAALVIAIIMAHLTGLAPWR